MGSQRFGVSKTQYVCHFGRHFVTFTMVPAISRGLSLEKIHGILTISENPVERFATVNLGSKNTRLITPKWVREIMNAIYLPDAPDLPVLRT